MRATELIAHAHEVVGKAPKDRDSQLFKRVRTSIQPAGRPTRDYILTLCGRAFSPPSAELNFR